MDEKILQIKKSISFLENLNINHPLSNKIGVDVYLEDVKYLYNKLIENNIKEMNIDHEEYDIELIGNKLDEFIKEYSYIWDLTDTAEFIMEHREELIKILTIKDV